MALFGAFPVVFALGGFLLGFGVVAPGAECLEVVGVVGAALFEVFDVVGVEGFSGWVVVSAVLAGVLVAVEDFVAEGGWDVFVGFLVVPGHYSVVIARGLRCQPMISPLWVAVAV